MEIAKQSRRRVVIIIVATVFCGLFLHLSFGTDQVSKRWPKQLPSLQQHSEEQNPDWLILTISPVHSIQRRTIIRNTWQRLYKNAAAWQTRFVIGRPSTPAWQSVIDAENKTYGDIVQPSDVQETNDRSAHYRTLESYRYLTKREGRTDAGALQNWKFVTKMDEDSFIDARTFYRDWIVPLREMGANRTFVGDTLSDSGSEHSANQFATMTSDLVPLLADLWEANPIKDSEENLLFGRLLFEAGIDYKHIGLENHLSYDYEPINLRWKGKPWAAPEADLSGRQHAIGPGTINPHKMKDDETYLQVAACFGPDGLLDPDADVIS